VAWNSCEGPLGSKLFARHCRPPEKTFSLTTGRKFGEEAGFAGGGRLDRDGNRQVLRELAFRKVPGKNFQVAAEKSPGNSDPVGAREFNVEFSPVALFSGIVADRILGDAEDRL
jgi:hypothetical protein